MKKVLLTGGCGYIGSSVTAELFNKGFEVVVIDNLSTGSLRLLKGTNVFKFIECGAEEKSKVVEIIKENDIDTVFHFAGSIVVSESVVEPLKYYNNNLVTTLKLLEACVESGVKNFIFSSTGSVYKESCLPVNELSPTLPQNPYSNSKLLCEGIIKDICTVHNIKYGILRYFNVAGADSERGLGQISKVSTHLIKIASEMVVGKRSFMSVYGTDYDTEDGTCVRDYIHIKDLASAHYSVLKHLLSNGSSGVFNCGYGKGYSVLDVVSVIKELYPEGDIRIEKRREGDAVSLIADCSKIKSELHWEPKHNNLKSIISSAIEWERSLL